MGFKIKMAEISKEELKEIREDRPTGRYDGPTPPPGIYEVKISRAWFGETKAGDDTLKVSFLFDNEGENAVYNGYDFINNYGIPADATEPSFIPRVNQLDAFLIALSDGKMGFSEFQEAMVAGKNDIDPAKKNKMGYPVTQIGNVKISGNKKIKIKTRLREYNGKDYVDLHYILNDEATSKPKKRDEDLDDFDDVETSADTSVSDDDADDLDEWLDS